VNDLFAALWGFPVYLPGLNLVGQPSVLTAFTTLKVLTPVLALDLAPTLGLDLDLDLALERLTLLPLPNNLFNILFYIII
jgi:hypothetical protein